MKGLNRLAALLLLLGAGSASAEGGLPVAERPTEAIASDGRYISWREHIIDEALDGGEPLTGGDGLVMGDLDGDGFEDIVSVHESDTVYDGVPAGYVRLAFGSADPRRWHNRTLAQAAEAGAPEDAAIADVNGDGHPDVIVAGELAHLLYLQNPGGSAARTDVWPRLIPSLTRGRGSFIRVFFADLDDDGRPEVIATNKGAQNPAADASELTAISVFRIDGDPLVDANWQEHELGRYRVPHNAEPVDIDGDGDLDIVAGVRVEGRLIVFENVSEGGRLKFLEHPVVTDGPRAAGFNLAFADFDGDGRTDIVSAMAGGLGWLQQPERFDQPWRTHAIGTLHPDATTGIALADITGNGLLDVMTGSYSRGPRDTDGDTTPEQPLGRLAWFENPGAGAASWRRHDISRRIRGMFDKFVARDLNGDGYIDLVGTRGNSEPFDGVFWLEQVRSPAPKRAFERARADDSAEVSLPPSRSEVGDYKVDAGPHAVTIEKGVWVDARRNGRKVPWKLYLPAKASEALPVVVWSHGLGGSRDGAEYLGRHLASHGYAAFHIQHAGSDAAVLRRGRNALTAAVGDPDVSLQRFLDVPFAVRQIRDMTAEGTFAGRFDVDRMGMSGHSYGAISTQVAAGQRFGAAQLQFGVPGFKGAFAMSPSPPRAGSANEAFRHMLMPIFHLTGTADGSPLGDDLQPIDRRVPYDTIDNVDQYLLILDKGVHMTFSGRRQPPYPELDRHHALIRMAAVAFWDMVLKNDAQARAWLEAGGFAAAIGDGGTFEFKRHRNAGSPAAIRETSPRGRPARES